jgi:hypothetical protein
VEDPRHTRQHRQNRAIRRLSRHQRLAEFGSRRWSAASAAPARLLSKMKTFDSRFNRDIRTRNTSVVLDLLDNVSAIDGYVRLCALPFGRSETSRCTAGSPAPALLEPTHPRTLPFLRATQGQTRIHASLAYHLEQGATTAICPQLCRNQGHFYFTLTNGRIRLTHLRTIG